MLASCKKSLRAAFVCKHPWGNLHAVDIEADSVPMCVADLLVSNRIRRASTFERYRVEHLHLLYRRPFSFSQDYYHLAKGDVRFCFHLSAGASVCQAAPDGICSVCPPPS